jgi:hypothetical protein
MADQKFYVGYKEEEDKVKRFEVEASEVTQEGTAWKITGDKGTLWVSGEAFVYAVPLEMIKKN